MTTGERLSVLEYGVESVGLGGMPESGDLHLVKETSTGVLIAVVDGIGHGVEAARAARLAVGTVEAHAEEPISDIVIACDKQLRGTRGVVMALVSINARNGSLTWLSVGNVQGTLIRMDLRVSPAYETIFAHSGVVGFSLRRHYASAFSISNNDVLILSTDGIRNDYSQRIALNVRYAEGVLNQLTEPHGIDISKDAPAREPNARPHDLALFDNIDFSFVAGGRSSFSPGNLAGYICRKYLTGSDDALILVAKYLGNS